MIISAIVAMGQSRQIGYGGQMPWKITSDLKRFKSLTLGHSIVMGRKTFESIGHPLPERRNIVLSRKGLLLPPNTILIHNFEKVIEYCKKIDEKELFICGGQEIYSLTEKYWDKIYLTRVQYDGLADTYFPQLNWGDYLLTHHEFIQGHARDEYPSEFLIYEKNS